MKNKVCLMGHVSTWDLPKEELISKYFLFETDADIEIGVPFKRDGKCYYAGMIRRKEDICLVREFIEKDGEETYADDEITCPYCGDKDRDSWEAGDGEDNQECHVCGSIFSWEAQHSVTYSSQPIKKHEIKIIK